MSKESRVSTDYIPTREDRFSFGIWTVGWQGVDVFGSAVRPPDQLRTPTLAPGETWHDVRDATADTGTLGRRGLAYEHLDQLALEHLYGIR